jgi:hypothetical protein
VDDCPSDVPIIGPYVRVLLDMLHKRVLSAVELPRECIDIPDRYVFATDFNNVTTSLYNLAPDLLLLLSMT